MRSTCGTPAASCPCRGISCRSCPGQPADNRRDLLHGVIGHYVIGESEPLPPHLHIRHNPLDGSDEHRRHLKYRVSRDRAPSLSSRQSSRRSVTITDTTVLSSISPNRAPAACRTCSTFCMTLSAKRTAGSRDSAPCVVSTV